MSSTIRPEEREREFAEIRRLAEQVAVDAAHAHLGAVDGVVLGAPRSGVRLPVFAAAAFGFAAGLLVALTLIPEQPTRILVPVEQPAPAFNVPENGVSA